MDYLLKVGEIYHYNRRIPASLRKFDPRKVVRISLRTDSRRDARKLALVQNHRLESYWRTLVQSGETHSEKVYQAVLERARLLGFSYLPCNDVAALPLNQVIDRLRHVEKHDYSPHHVEAVLGGRAPPVIRLEDVTAKFFHYSKDKLLNKTAYDIRKWKNPRTKAMNNFCLCIGGAKPLHELTRDDTLKFRDWWIDRMAAEDLVSVTANKDFMHVKVMVTTVAKNAGIKLDFDQLFSELTIDKDDSKKRLPFTTEYLLNTLLNSENLSGLNAKARAALYAFAETGAGISELVGVLPEDIFLKHAIPHIRIKPRQMKGLKTKFRAREIPLVGFALDAFRAFPEGFNEYSECPDTLSDAIGKYLRENSLLPSDQYTVYSLRHSFQDRLLAVNAPDRVQADLMGHKFQRPAYGNGSSLEQKLEWLRKIQLKIDHT